MDSITPSIVRIATILTIFSLAASCDDGLSGGMAIPGDYFPLQENLRQRYQVKYYSAGVPPTTYYFTDTAKFITKGDSVFLGKTYRKILRYYDMEVAPDNTVRFSDLFQLVRKEGSQYFTLPLYDSTEVMFLDSDKDPGSSWVQYRFNDLVRMVYTVRTVNAKKLVNGKEYGGVIEVEEKIYTDYNNAGFELASTVQHSYAREKGEIASFLEFPEGKAYVSNIKMSRIN